MPPDGTAFFRLPEYSNGEGANASIKYATVIPNLVEVGNLSNEECQARRKAKMGFNYNWEFDRKKSQWLKVSRKKTIGTPCQSFLFHSSLGDVKWSSTEIIANSQSNGVEVPLSPGLYDLIIENWQLKPEVESDNGRIGSLPVYYESEDVGPYCADNVTFDWDIEDATHLI